jgi:hypothetical protein
MDESLGDLMTAELAIYWDIGMNNRKSPKRKDYVYNIPVAAAALFVAGVIPNAPRQELRLQYIDNIATGLTQLYKQFH